MIRSVLIHGELHQARLASLLVELVDLAETVVPGDRLEVVIDSPGGDIKPLLSFVDCVEAADCTLALVRTAHVKIYKAYSAAAFLAVWMGNYREMASGSTIGFHLPLISLDACSWNHDDGRISEVFLGPARRVWTLLSDLMATHGLTDPALKTKLFNGGIADISGEECLSLGLVQALVPGSDSGEPHNRSAAIAAPRSLGHTPIRTILLSGRLDWKLLDRVLSELRFIAANDSREPVTVVIDSPGGNVAATLRFLDTLRQDDDLQRMLSGSAVKIYGARDDAALLAFSLGAVRELSRDASVMFTFGQSSIQFGDPAHVDPDGCLAPGLREIWREYMKAVSDLTQRLGLTADLAFNTMLAAGSGATLSAEECLRRGLVSRLF